MVNAGRQGVRQKLGSWLKASLVEITIVKSRNAPDCRSIMSKNCLFALSTKRAFTIAFCWLCLFCGTALAHTVTLTWTLSSDATPLRQNVWRQKGCTGKFAMRAQLGATAATFTDLTVKNGISYCYYVTVTDKTTKKVSPASNIATAVIPAT